jgi:hypothetical protein
MSAGRGAPPFLADKATSPFKKLKQCLSQHRFEIRTKCAAPTLLLTVHRAAVIEVPAQSPTPRPRADEIGVSHRIATVVAAFHMYRFAAAGGCPGSLRAAPGRGGREAHRQEHVNRSLPAGEGTPRPRALVGFYATHVVLVVRGHACYMHAAPACARCQMLRKMEARMDFGDWSVLAFLVLQDEDVPGPGWAVAAHRLLHPWNTQAV